MQCMIYAVVLTHWEMELEKAGDLTSYSVRTQHAAIRGFNYYQRVEPFYTNFMRTIQVLAKDPVFRTYPLAHHLTYHWLGGNLRVSNQPSPSEKEIGGDTMRNYYLSTLIGCRESATCGTTSHSARAWTWKGPWGRTASRFTRCTACCDSIRTISNGR